MNRWTFIPGETLLAHLFVLRFPILTAVLLVALPPIALRLAKPLLANLFDLTPLKAVAVTIAACVMAWTALFSGWVVMSYGPVRFGIAHLSFVPEAQVPPWSIIWAIVALPLPLLVSAWFYSVRNQATTPVRFLLGLLAGFVVSALLVIAGRLLLDYIVNFREVFSARQPAHMAGFLRGFLDAQGRLLPGHRVAITAFFLSFLVYLILGFGKYLRWRIFRDVPSLAYVLCLFTLACWTLTGLSFFLDAYRVPVVLVLVGYLTATAQFSSSDHYYHVFPVRSGAGIATPAQILAASHLDSVILVAANGGGIQSSAWTAKVLTERDREWRRSSPQNDTLFARSLRAISLVSGGSVGAMFFTAAYSNDGLSQNDSKLKDVVRNATTLSLDDVAWGLIYPDLWRTLTPFLWKEFVDRGNALEQAFERLVPETADGLSSWRSSVASGRRPANLFNATITETGGLF